MTAPFPPKKTSRPCAFCIFYTGINSLDYAGPQVSVAVIIVTIIAVVYCCVGARQFYLSVYNELTSLGCTQLNLTLLYSSWTPNWYHM